MSSKPLSIAHVCEILATRDNFTLLCHAQPDGDTVGSAYALGYALKELGKTVKILCADEIPQKFRFITDSFINEESKNGTIISLDVADPKLMGKYCDVFEGMVEIAIDHHISNVNYSKYLLLDSSASATCEIVYEIVKELCVPMSKEILSALYTGIVTDTGCFKFSNTTARTHIIAAELINLGVDYAEINRLMFDNKSRQRVKLEGAVMDNIEYYCGGKVSVITLSRNIIENSGCDESELEGINALSRTIEGVVVGITIKERPTGTKKISLRTNAPLNAMEICREFGGGGHERAAGCSFADCSIEDVKVQLLEVVKRKLEEAGCQI